MDRTLSIRTFYPHEKTTCKKSGKTAYAASGQARNMRVTGIQAEIKVGCYHDEVLIDSLSVTQVSSNFFHAD